MKSVTIGIVLAVLTFGAARPAHAQEPVAPGSRIVALPLVPMQTTQTRPAQGVTFLRPSEPPPRLRHPAGPPRDELVRYRRPPTETEKRVFGCIFLAFIGAVIITHMPR